MASKVVDRDKGYRAAMRGCKSIKGASLDIGLLGNDAAKLHQPEDGSETSGITIGEIGEVHELGLGNNPVRSWLRGYLDENQSTVQQKVTRLHEQVATGKMQEVQALTLLGLDMKGGIQQRIAAGIQPQVTAATQRRKGPNKTTPLINSGQFRSSINFKVRANGKATTGAK